MKKFFYSILFFIFALVTPCIYAKAEFLPPTLPDTSVVPGFLESVAQYEIVNDSRIYMPASDLEKVNLIVNGRSINSSIEYTYLDNANILTPMEFYTSDGVLVSQDDTYTVYGTSDVGPFMFVAKKDTGETLYQSLDGQTFLSTLVGGRSLQQSFPEFVVRNLSMSSAPIINRIMDTVDVAKNDSMIIYGNSLTASEKEFLSDYRFYFKMTSNYGWSVYVPNACSNSVLVNDVNSGITSFHGTVPTGNPYNMQPCVFANDPSQVYFVGSGSYVGLRQEISYIFGTQFNYCSSYRNIFGVLYAGGEVDMELPTYDQYNQYKNASSDSVYLAPVDDVDNAPTDNIYNYTYVINNPPTQNRYINNSYNYEGDTNYNNYPVYYNYEYPSYPATNEYVTNIYNYYTTPSQGGSIGTIDPNEVTDGIPILNNLKYRFPFSIPFDIYNLINGLSVQREAPHFEWEVYLPVINYTWQIDFDLSSWDTQATIFRTCFLILFIIGLGMWAYNHFFGS